MSDLSTIDIGLGDNYFLYIKEKTTERIKYEWSMY